MATNWIDPNIELPEEIEFFPVKVKALGELIPFYVLGLFFLAMGAAAPIAFIYSLRQNGFSGQTAYLGFGAIFIMLFLALFLYVVLNGAIVNGWIARAAARDQLRHGIFVSPEAVLVRLPHEMHFIPRSTFKTAEITEKQRGQRRFKFLTFPFQFDGVEYEPIQLRAQLQASLDQVITVINRSN